MIVKVALLMQAHGPADDIDRDELQMLQQQVASLFDSKFATAAKEAAAKVPSKAVISTKPNTSTKKNSATATVTGLKPGQKIKVTVNVRPKP